MKYILLTILFTMGLISCNQDVAKSKASGSDQLYKEVMAVHDEVMPKMSQIHKLKKELRNHLESAEESQKQEILDQITYLQKADDAMMDWMHDLNVPEDETAKAAYLKGQMPLIKEVKNIMLDAIAKGQQLTNKLTEAK